MEDDAVMSLFLERWTARMQAAGYLAFTTARRGDCIAACRGLIRPILDHAAGGTPPLFETLRENVDGWALPLLEMGMRHVRRGVTADMYLGCFITFERAVLDTVKAMPWLAPAVTAAQASDAAVLVDLYVHAFEVLWLARSLAERDSETSRVQQARQDGILRLLTLEKCRFQNVFETTSDGMLVMDAECRVRTANRALLQYTGVGVENRRVWEVLDLEGGSPADFLRFYPPGQTVEVSPFGEGLFFRLSVISMGGVSMADAEEYLVLLTNITPQVLQREMLEEAVKRHTGALVEERRRLEELTITLRNVLASIHTETESRRAELASGISRFLKPALERMAREQNPQSRQAAASLIRSQLDALIAPEGDGELEEGLARLTLAELRVCRLIQAGHRSKEIADLLHISPETVQTHRRSIRRKLGLRGRDTQLAAHLLHAGLDRRQE